MVGAAAVAGESDRVVAVAGGPAGLVPRFTAAVEIAAAAVEVAAEEVWTLSEVARVAGAGVAPRSPAVAAAAVDVAGEEVRTFSEVARMAGAGVVPRSPAVAAEAAVVDAAAEAVCALPELVRMVDATAGSVEPLRRSVAEAAEEEACEPAAGAEVAAAVRVGVAALEGASPARGAGSAFSTATVRRFRGATSPTLLTAKGDAHRSAIGGSGARTGAAAVAGSAAAVATTGAGSGASAGGGLAGLQAERASVIQSQDREVLSAIVN